MTLQPFIARINKAAEEDHMEEVKQVVNEVKVLFGIQCMIRRYYYVQKHVTQMTYVISFCFTFS